MRVKWKSTRLPSWTHLVLISLCWVLWLCHSFKCCALLPSFLFQNHDYIDLPFCQAHMEYLPQCAHIRLQTLTNFKWLLNCRPHFLTTVEINNKKGTRSKPMWLELKKYSYTWFIDAQRWFRWKKNLPAMQEAWVLSLAQEDLLEKEMGTQSSILAWESPWMEEPGGLQSLGSQMRSWLTD